jgi:large subunit ribosomal protein L21
MYAIIKTGGKQYKVAEGDVIKVETLEAEEGKNVEFDQVLMVANGDAINVGVPVVSGAKVSAEVVSHGRHKKVEILKFKRRKHHMKHMGHRQNFTEVKITKIEE